MYKRLSLSTYLFASGKLVHGRNLKRDEMCGFYLYLYNRKEKALVETFHNWIYAFINELDFKGKVEQWLLLTKDELVRLLREVFVRLHAA